jgi:hypothetical protein
LAALLRWDAHQAASAELIREAATDPARGLTLRLKNGLSIQYAVASNGIERVVRQNQEIEHRDRFRVIFPQSYWSLDTDREGPLLALHLVNHEASPRTASNEQILQAAVGIAAPQIQK